MAAGNRRGHNNAVALTPAEQEADANLATAPGANAPVPAERVYTEEDLPQDTRAEAILDEVLSEHDRADALVRGVDLHDMLVERSNVADAYGQPMIDAIRRGGPIPSYAAGGQVSAGPNIESNYQGFEPVAGVPEERTSASRYVPAVTWVKAHPGRAARITDFKGSPASAAQTINKAFGPGVKAVTRTDPDTKVTSVYVQAVSE